MNILDKLKATYSIYKTIDKSQRGSNFKLGLNSLYSNEPDFLDDSYGQEYGVTSINGGVVDYSISPKDIYEMVYRDSYVAPLLQQIVEAIFKKGVWVEPIEDDNGNKLGSDKDAEQMTEWLQGIDIQERLMKVFYGLMGDGGGNVLLFTAKNNGRVEPREEAFLSMGYERVAEKVDSRNQKIRKYQVIDREGSLIYELDPASDYVKHLRYQYGGNWRFSSNPSKQAVYWYVLKKKIIGSMNRAYKNGLQSPVLMSPDYSKLATFIKTWGDLKNQGVVSEDNLPKSWRNILTMLADRSKSAAEVIKSITGNPKMSNKLIDMKMPYDFQRIDVSNKEMETTKLMELANENIGYAYRTSRAILEPRYEKFSNAEMGKDTWEEYVIDTFKRMNEKTISEFYLPIAFPQFNQRQYRVRQGREPSDEAIQLFQAKTARNESVSKVLLNLSTIPGYRYNLNTNEIEEIKPEEIEEETKQDVEEQVDIQNDEIQDAHEEETEERLSTILETHKRRNPSSKVSLNEVKEIYKENGKGVKGIVKVRSFLVERITFEEKRDRVFRKYHDTVNMSRTELEKWSENPCSKKASVDRSPIRRNLELLDTKKNDWTQRHVTNASKTIAFIARMSKVKGGQEVKLEDGTSCGTKKVIALKNWAFNMEKRLAPKEYKTEIKRDCNCRADTIVDKAVVSKDANKFQASIEKAITKQLTEYLTIFKRKRTLAGAKKSLTKDLPSITTKGLNVNTLKQQLSKFYRIGINEFEETSGKKLKRIDFDSPKAVLQLLDAKSQLLVKGFDALSETDRKMIEEIYGRETASYAGMDVDTSSELNTIISRGIENQSGVKTVAEQILAKIPDMAKYRAKRIAETEISQGIEGSRWALYKDWSVWKKWTTANDSRVRPSHVKNKDQGWIKKDEAFSNGSMTTASEINCRCSIIYSDSELKPQ